MAQAPGQNWQALLFTVVLHAGFLGLVAVLAVPATPTAALDARWPEAEANRFNLALRTRLYQRGVSMIGCAYVEGRLLLRLLITNVSIDEGHVERFFADLVGAGRALAAEWTAVTSG